MAPVDGRACTQFEALKRVFPAAAAIGLTGREPVRRGVLRQPHWPGTCKQRYWFASYNSASTYVEFSLTPYSSHEQALVALAEPDYGPVERLRSGAVVRRERSQVSVDGVMKQHAGIASVYRNVFISSGSIAHQPVSLATQERLHRRIHASLRAFR